MTLTESQIQELPTGEDTDALVAEALGWKKLEWVKQPYSMQSLPEWAIEDGDKIKPELFTPRFSTDIAAACTLLNGEWNMGTIAGTGMICVAIFINGEWFDGEADTAPLAICRAFLLAKLKGAK